MPAGPVTGAWAAGVWADTVWEVGVWAEDGGGMSIIASNDLQTQFADYIRQLRAANPGADVSTLIEKDKPNVYAATPGVTDMNTRYKKYFDG